MDIKKKATVVRNIRQTGGQNGLPGNFLINTTYDAAGKPTPESWFPSRDIRNSLLGNGLNSRIPCLWLVGCTLRHDVLTITEQDIADAKAAGKLGFEYKLRNRKEPIVYKTAGSHNINVEIDATALSAEKLMMVSDLSMKYARTNVPTVASAAPLEAEEIIDETLKDDAPVDAPADVPADAVAHETITEN